MYKRPVSDIKYLVVHHSVTGEGWTTDEIRYIHKCMGYSDIGYHFLVNWEGLKVGRCALYTGAHVIPEKPPYKYWNMNYLALGLCIIGNYQYNIPSKKVINETVYAIKRICKKYNIPIDRKHILGHRRISRTVCPGIGTMPEIYKKLGI